jgi:transposase-like protein
MKVKKSSIMEFRENFGTKDKCLSYLKEQKLKDGFCCSKCKSTNQKKGYLKFDIRCRDCEYNESPTASTLFHSMKIKLPVAFEMIYRISVSKKGISCISLSREYDLNYKTAYNFKRKIQQAMSSSESHPLTGHVEVDELMYGGVSKGCQGRSSKSDKLKICLAVEIREDKKKGKKVMGRAYALPIDNFSNDELKSIFEKHIDRDALVKTDKWRGYNKQKETYNLEQVKSESGANFPEIHILIMNLKNWIRGIHHRISKNHLKGYLDEFFFRFNRRTFLEKLPMFTIDRMINHKPSPVNLTSSGYYG